jgi:surface carbohydrate biosynthesis protein (TIGR04326 family)
MKTLNSKTLIIVDNLNGRVLDLLKETHPEGQVDILTLGFTEQLFRKDNEEKMEATSRHFSFVDISDKYLQAQSLTRNYCLNLKMNLPKKTLHNKTTLFNLFKFKNFNAWWFLGFSEMGSFRIKFIDQLYFLTLVKLVLENTYSAVYLDLKDRPLKQVIEKDLSEKNIPFLSINQKQQGVIPAVKKHFLLWWFVSQFLFVITQLLKTIVLKLFSIGYRPVKTADFIAFFTFFPMLWSKKTNHEFHNSISSSLLNYTADFYQSHHLIYSTSLTATLKMLTKNIKRFKEQKIIFLEKYIPLRGFLFFLNINYYLSIFKYNWRYKKKISEKYEGYDISSLITKSIDESLYDMEFFRDVFISYSLSAFTSKFNLKAVVHPSEFQCYEKAIWLAAKGKCPSIALQHSAIGKNWLNYYFAPEDLARQGQQSQSTDTMPLPDLYLCSGGYPYEVLKQNNLPEPILKLIGAFRYNYLKDRTVDRKQKIDIRKKLGLKEKVNTFIVLSGVNKSESLDMIFNVAAYVQNMEQEVQVLFKSHPIRVIDCEVQEIFSRRNIAGLLNIIPVKSNYYDYLSAADVCCFCNSTIGIESIVLGTPALSFDNIHSMVSFDMIEVGKAVYPIKSIHDFKQALITINANEEQGITNNELRAEAIHKTFYKLDGKSMERFVTNISPILN